MSKSGGGILVISAHPDDETFGCGGTMAVHAEKGIEVEVLSLTCTPEKRSEELISALTVLGVKGPVIWMEEKISIDNRHTSLLADIIVDKRPRAVITHLPFDYHREHRLALELVKEAIEWAGHQTIYSDAWVVERLLLMEVNTLIPHPHILVDISGAINLKKTAMEEFPSQLEKFPERYYQNFNLRKAQLRGIQAGCPYAEAFIEVAKVQHSPFYPIKSTKLIF
jgi:LmbE family N-acetylglucosaminyl deacetylase